MGEPSTVATASGAPLAGVRVLDLSRLLPGPMCSLYLAQLGADVVKVEDTGRGDYARTMGTTGGDAAFFTAVNRGKRSIALDLKSADGHGAFMRLAARANVIVEGFRPGVAAALRIDYAAIAALLPRIVYASISGYGQDGPRAGAAGHDINYLGYAGVLDQTGERDRPPALANLQIADLLGGAAVPAIAIVAALYDAARTGRGRHVDIAMADAALAHNVFPLQALVETGEVEPRGAGLLTGGIPAYGVYRTRDDRYVAVGALEEKFWRVLCETLARPDLIPLGRARGKEGEHARRELAAIFASAPLQHWTERFAGVDCCVTPVLRLDEAMEDAQFLARGASRRASDGAPMFGPPFRISECDVAVDRAAPAQGEHSRALLREAGYADDVIDALAARGVIRDGAAPASD